MKPSKYSDQLVDWLIEEGYSHCFFVAGGNIMHLLDSVRSRMTCIPFVNEIGAAIAAEYFTASSGKQGGKAFVLVTAGPGLTNTVTAVASAYTESRELLVIGGQVKRSDLGNSALRQRGIQEIDGVSLLAPLCKVAVRLETPAPKGQVVSLIREGTSPRKGPVFLEICLDAQGAMPIDNAPSSGDVIEKSVRTETQIDEILRLLKGSSRPVLLLGGGLDHHIVSELRGQIESLGLPVMTTWNGADLIDSTSSNYFGRPNTWGQRYSNMIIQQSDLLIALGSRLGLQQTGFAWQQFVPKGKIVQVDIDEEELFKGHPKVFLGIKSDANLVLQDLLLKSSEIPVFDEWVNFCRKVQRLLPIDDPQNKTAPGFVPPVKLITEISKIAHTDDNYVPCSSGGAFTVAMQSILQRGNQRILSNKGMASMGYGLSGAIGVSLANPKSRTFLFEGDGGFAQNLQELGTVAANNLPIKIFLFSNNGYASIRMTQRNYFDGAWIGCDTSTGLGLPNWRSLANSYGIPYGLMSPGDLLEGAVSELLTREGPAFIEVPIDPEQTYYPKIMSSMSADGNMVSNPLHIMHPELDDSLLEEVFKYN